MLFGAQVVILLFYFFLSCQALQCTTGCSYTYNFTKPFDIPDQCNQIVSAGRCFGYLSFSYDSQTYTVEFQSSSTTYIFSADNRRSLWFNFLSTTSPQFLYQISHACKNKDDCARDLIRNAAIEMLQKQYNFRGIINELNSLISSPPLTSNNSVITCYNSKENVVQCGTSAKPGLCIISHKVIGNAINRSCIAEIKANEVPVHIFQTSNYVNVDVHCNQSLCNTDLTLQTVKDILFKYNVTTALDGRLVESIPGNGSKLMTSALLMILMISALLFN